MEFCRQSNTLRQYLTAGLYEVGLNVRELIESAEGSAVPSLGNKCHTVTDWYENGELIVVPEVPLSQSLAERAAQAWSHGIAVQVDNKVQGHIGPKCWIRECGKKSAWPDPFKGAKDLHTIADYLDALSLDLGQVKGVAEFYVPNQGAGNGEVRIFVNRADLERLVKPYVSAYSDDVCAEQVAFATICKIQRGLRRKKEAS